jgi:hypothetical protein
MNSLKHRLTQLKEVMAVLFPECIDLVPCEKDIDINKLGDGGQKTSDTYNAARKI